MSGDRSTTRPRNLLITRVGRLDYYVDLLCDPADRNYDVLVSCYDALEDKPCHERAILTEVRPGAKVVGYAGLFRDHDELIAGYDRVALWDEDLRSTPADVSLMFDICRDHDLQLAQPSLSPDSYYSYAATVNQPFWSLRHVNFVEMMCPFFRADYFQSVRPLFDLGYETGIDVVWSSMPYDRRRSIAIVDAVQVRHTEPIGRLKAENGFVGSRTYEDDIYELLADFDLSWEPCVPTMALAHNGREITGRPYLALGGLSSLRAVWRRPGRRSRLRSWAVHMKHLLQA